MIPEDKFIRKSMFPTLFGKKIGRARLSERPQLSPDQFHGIYYADQDINKEVIQITYDLAEKNFRIPMHGIIPEDRWVEDIYGDQGCDYLELFEFVEDIENEFEIKISDEELRELKTVDDLITFLDQHDNSDENERENDKRMERYNDTESYFVELVIVVLWVAFNIWNFIFHRGADGFWVLLSPINFIILIVGLFYFMIKLVNDSRGDEDQTSS